MESLKELEDRKRGYDVVKEAKVRQKVKAPKVFKGVMHRAKRLLLESASELAIIAHGRHAL